MCVCPQGGRVSASVHAGMPYPPRPGGHPPTPGTRQTPPTPRTRQTPPPRTRQTPPGSRLQHTVYERPVRIPLECILVHTIVCLKMPLPYGHLSLVPQYPFVTSSIDSTKTMKIMAFPAHCEQALKFRNVQLK